MRYRAVFSDGTLFEYEARSRLQASRVVSQLTIFGGYKLKSLRVINKRSNLTDVARDLLRVRIRLKTLLETDGFCGLPPTIETSLRELDGLVHELGALVNRRDRKR